MKSNSLLTVKLKLKLAISVSLITIINLSICTAARKEYLKSGTTIDIPSVGIKIKLFKEMSANPLGSVKIHTLTQRQGTEIKKIDAYSPEDLWIRDQLAGRWMNKLATISIYRMTLTPPDKIPKIYQNLILKDEYRKWKELQSEKKITWDDEKIIKWLQFMTGKQFKSPPETVKKGAPRQAVTKIFSTDSEENSIYYVITSSYSKDKPVLIHIALNPGIDTEKSMKAISTALSAAKLYKPKTTGDKSKRRVVHTSQSLKKEVERSPEYTASRDAVIQSIQNLKTWWYIETDNFVMVANIKNKKTARDLSINLEKSRSVYTKFYPIKKPLRAVSVARMFEERDQYIAYVGEELKWSGGVWISRIKELVVSPMDWGSRSDQRKMMIETTFHEAFHQYIFFATGERETSSWFNEGNAQFFEEMSFRGSKFSIGINKRKAEQMKSLTSLQQIRNMLKMSPREFYSESGRDDNYPLAWGLLFFLQKGAPIMRSDNNYHQIPMKYYDAIIETGNPEKATEIAWKGVNLEQFANDFKKFWNSSSLLKKAERYDPLKSNKN